MANKVIEYIIRATDETGESLKSAGSRLKDFASNVGRNLVNIQAGWSMLSGAVRSVVGAFETAASKIWSATQSAFDYEALAKKWEMLFKDAELAEKHAQMLDELGETPPFSTEQFDAASMALQKFGGTALNTRDSLVLCGDAAYATNNEFGAVADAVGRAYASLRDGQPLERTTTMLRNMGLIAPLVAADLESMQKAGASSREMWLKLKDSLGQYNGAMASASQSGAGMVQSLKGSWAQAIQEFGMCFTSLAKDQIGTLQEKLSQLRNDGTITKWADECVRAVTPFANMIGNLFDGQAREITIRAAWDDLKAVLEFGGEILKAGLVAGWEYVAGNLPSIGAAIWKGISLPFSAGMKAGKWLGWKAGRIGMILGSKAAGQSENSLEQDLNLYDAGFYPDDASSNASTAARIVSDAASRMQATIAENAEKVNAETEARKTRDAAKKASAAAPAAPSTPSADTATEALTDAAKAAVSAAKTAEQTSETAAETEANRKEAERDSAEQMREEERRKLDANLKTLEGFKKIEEEFRPIAEKTFFTDDEIRQKLNDDKETRKEQKKTAHEQEKWNREIANIQDRLATGTTVDELSKKDQKRWKLYQEQQAAAANVANAQQIQAQAAANAARSSGLLAQINDFLNNKLENIVGMGA